MRICAIEDCGKKHFGKGLCKLHYKKQWDALNAEKRKRGYKEYNLANKEKIYKDQQNWKHTNWDYYKAHLQARKKRVRQSTPKWANLQAITDFYKNCPEGCHVDHVIPLNGKNVSGLHVLENLQYLPAAENLKKSNKTA